MKMKLLLAVAFVFFGIWIGINLAKDKPLFSNPFADGELQDRASSAASKVVEKSRQMVDHAFEGK